MRKVAIAALAVLALGIVAVPALASHPEVSLPGSNFEIDTNANLKQDDPTPSIDWASVSETRKTDKPTGQQDDSFGEGTKEDTAVPAVVSGQIPNNKSDLLNFGVYSEEAAAGKFLNVFWQRVQEPSGTTNMDFEFNKSKTLSSNGVTPVRTAGDILIQYDLASGGTNVQLFLSVWVTSGPNSGCEASGAKVPCWGDRVNLTSSGLGTGSINTSPIPAADSDGLSPTPPGVPISTRTFGEAQIDFDAFSGTSTDPCVSFGSAYLKSRSSDSFTAALKDFIAPVGVNISNCGTVHVIKKDDANPGNLLDGAGFDLVADASPTNNVGGPGSEDTTIVDSCVTGELPGTTDDGVCDFTAVVAGEYWVVETSAPTGYDLPDPAYQHVTVSASGTVEVTFIDPVQLGAIQITKTAKNKEADGSSIFLDDVVFTITGGNLPAGGTDVTTANGGIACLDGLAFATDYVVTEKSAPTGYVPDGDGISDAITVDNKAECADDPYGGETVSFNNLPLTDVQVSVDSQIDGGTASTVECKDADGNVVGSGSTTTGGDTAAGEVAADDLAPGTYTCTVVIDP